MTGVSPFLFFHKHTIITIKDATSIMPQSFTHMDAGTQTQNKDARTQAEIDDEILLEEHYNRKAGIYPEPEGDPSY